MPSLNIVHTPVRAFPYMGGVEYHVHHIANRLLSIGYQVTVVAAKLSDSFSQETEYRRILLPWLFKVTNTEITCTLPFVLSSLQYDIIHSHIPTPWTSDWSMLVASVSGKKKVITIHNDMSKNGFIAQLITKIYVNTLMRVALHLADKIIVVNPNWEKSFACTRHILLPHKQKIVCIPNGVDTEVFIDSAPKKKQRILCVSILDKYHDFKGIPYLLEAFVEILRKYPEATLQIVGEGELKEKYRLRAEELGIGTATEFSGEAQPHELAKFYSAATVFVLPSTDTEGFGLVLLESLACKTPVITTNVAGVTQDIANHHCGSVVESANPAAIAKAVEKYFDDQDLVKKQGEIGRNMVVDTYSWALVAQKTADVYASL